jgi:DNA-binding SARP family transcriptional activator
VSRYTIHLQGRFRVFDPEGKPVELRSAKAQGLIALLATVPELDRGRLWLQDKLWSDRAPVEAARSLRQELTQLRKHLNLREEVLKADRSRIWLDATRVAVMGEDAAETRDFLEGLDIRDPEFNRWLTEMRSSRDETETPGVKTGPSKQRISTTGPSRTLALVPSPAADAAVRIAEAELYGLVTRSLHETIDATILTALPAEPVPGLLIVSAQVLRSEQGRADLRVTLDEQERCRTLWSDCVRGWSNEVSVSQDPDCMALVSRIVDAVSNRWVMRATPGDRDSDADAMAHLAVRKLFTIDSGEIDEAEALLRAAYALEPCGVYQAWLAQLFTFRFVERLTADTKALVEASREACAVALQRDPTNSFVLAAVANATTILERNHVGGGELAQLSVRSNPANPFAWWALSNARQYSSEHEAAYQAARRCQGLTADTAFRFWGDFQLALTAAITGRIEEAIRLGETASVLAPKFRPPLRYLIAIYALRDRRDDARRCLARLISNEADFTPERLYADPDYPNSLMRKSGLVEVERIRQLG